MHFQKDAAERGALHGLVFWRVRVMLPPGVQIGKPKNFPSNIQEISIMWQARPRNANALCFNFYPFHVFLSWNLETHLSFISIFIFHFWTLLPVNYPSFSSCWGVEPFELWSAALVQFYHSFISMKLNNYWTTRVAGKHWGSRIHFCLGEKRLHTIAWPLSCIS